MEPKIISTIVAHVITAKVVHSSSESDDDNNDEELLLFQSYRNSHNKIEEYVQRTVMNYSLDDFRSHFRLTKSAVEVRR